MQNKNFNMKYLKRYEYKIFWTISDICNFNCPYCYRVKSNVKCYSTQKYSPEYIAECFNKTEKSWLIMLAGGEPFIMPGFFPLIKELTKKHHIQISSNLCSDDIYKFPDVAPTKKIMVLCASLHVPQREKVDPGFKNFIKKYLFLEEKGYRVLVNYVTWPPLLSRIEKDFEYLKSQGVKNITAYTFLGYWNGKYYPDSFSEEDIALISKLSIYKDEEDILRRQTRYKGIPCEAGYKYFTMDIDGNVNQCHTIKISHGNLFEGSFNPDLNNKICLADECFDTYMGESILKRKGYLDFKIQNCIKIFIKNKKS